MATEISVCKNSNESQSSKSDPTIEFLDFLMDYATKRKHNQLKGVKEEKSNWSRYFSDSITADTNNCGRKQRFWKESHNSEDEDDEDDGGDEGDGEGGEGGGGGADDGEGGSGGKGGGNTTTGGGPTSATDMPNTKPIATTDGDFNSGSIHYVDACTLWKFPSWLVERLDCSKIIEQACNLHSQQLRRTLMQQLKATSTDLIMYATVRREFLRTILVIELNNCARLLEVATSLEINEQLKTNFFSALQPCVSILEDENKSYSQDIVSLSKIMNEIYVSITPSASFRDQNAYSFNVVYCSFLIPGTVMQFTEMCCGGIVDNNWFSYESRYHAMVMVTPHVYDDPKGLQRGHLRKEKFRLEAYFDLEKGKFTGFDNHLRQNLGRKCGSELYLEHLVYNYFSKAEHYVEERSVFLMNGPETKGNLTFAKIYYGLVKSANL